MSRAKPYRQKPTKEFMVFYDIALNSRYYLVQESGPTKLTLEAGNNKKYKIQIGSEITCSCGGGRNEHCVHTIYAMLKIFRIDEGDPLLWQLAFTDTEIDKILERREYELKKNRAGLNQWQNQATSISDVYRQALQQLREDDRQTNFVRNQEPNWSSNAIKANVNNRKVVPPRNLEADETCCVCCDVLHDHEDLSYCLYGCGRQIHTECLSRCFKHNQSAGKQMSCPLCRTNFGDNALDILKENSTKFRKKKAEESKQEKRTQILQNHIGQNEKPQSETDRQFQCTCCKRNILYDAKYQCMICEEVQVCKTCFKINYHQQHEFLVRPAPDRDWEPAFRQDAVKQTSDYRKIMEELQTRELGPDDYDLLLNLEQKQSMISLHKWLAMGFEKVFKPPDEYYRYAKAYCVFCEAEIVDRSTGTQFKNCEHNVHKACLEDILRTKNECTLCNVKILDGYEKCLKIPKMAPNKVTKRKPTVEQNLRMAIMEEVKSPLGVSGTGFQFQEEIKESVVGRRDLFRFPEELKTKKKPLSQIRPKPSMLAKLTSNIESVELDFNLQGTQIGGLSEFMTSSTTTNSTQKSFTRRPQSLNTRIQEETKVEFNGNLAGTRIRQGSDELPSIERRQEIQRNQKVKEAIRKHQKDRALNKVNNLGANLPLSKYYREQVQPLQNSGSQLNIQPTVINGLGNSISALQAGGMAIAEGRQKSKRFIGLPPKPAHKVIPDGQKIDPEEYKDFIGDLQLDIRKIQNPRFQTKNKYGLIENAVPNDNNQLHQTYLDLQRANYLD